MTLSSREPEVPVAETVDILILDLLAWIGPNPRPYAEVLEAWRTSCPRLPVWKKPTSGATSPVVVHRASRH